MNTSIGVIVLASHLPKKTKASKINSCIDNILESGIDDITVMVNQEQWEIGAALSGYPVCIAVDNGASDVLNMVNTGIKALPGYITGVIIAAYDNPPVLSETLSALEKFHRQAPQCAVLPGAKCQNGYAALFPIESYHALSKGLMVDKLIPRGSGQLHAVQ